MKKLMALAAAFLITNFATAVCDFASAAQQSRQVTAHLGDVTQLVHLSSVSGCPTGYLTGRVAAEQFDERGADLTSFTIADGKGVPAVVSIDQKALRAMTPLAAEFMKRGLHSIVRKGNLVAVVVNYCGTARRVVYLDSIRRL